jgi:type IV pilus assembly protein PilF
MKFKQIVLLAVVTSILMGCMSSVPQKSTTNPEARFEQHIKLAKQYIGSKNRDLARVHLTKASRFKSRSNRFQLHNGYALLYQMEQEIELAEASYRKAIASNKTNSMVRYNFGAFLYNQERFKEALEQIKHASADLDYERRPQAFYIQGLAHGRLGQNKQALRAFEKTTQLSPGFAPPYLEAAEIYYAQQRLPIAKRALDQYTYMAQPNAKSLWLAVRLEDSFGNRDGAASEGLKLKNLFPYSRENLEYQKWLKQ